MSHIQVDLEWSRKERQPQKERQRVQEEKEGRTEDGKKVNVLKMYNNFGKTLTLTINMIEF